MTKELIFEPLYEMSPVFVKIEKKEWATVKLPTHLFKFYFGTISKLAKEIT